VTVRSFPDTGLRDTTAREGEKRVRECERHPCGDGVEEEKVESDAALPSKGPPPFQCFLLMSWQASASARAEPSRLRALPTGAAGAHLRHSWTFPRFFSVTRIKEGRKCGKKRKMVQEDVRTSSSLKDSVCELAMSCYVCEINLVQPN
jgi:hypothetical protein